MRMMWRLRRGLGIRGDEEMPGGQDEIFVGSGVMLR